jgi:hypothetical protein
LNGFLINTANETSPVIFRNFNQLLCFFDMEVGTETSKMKMALLLNCS